ncbi:MAG TPA: 4Fe-4S dicluster domain-containing protein [Actinomycetes bacterium]
MATEAVLDLAGLQALVDALRERGYTVLGPVVRDGAVVPAPVSSVDELPRGWGDEQDGAFYRLRRRDDDALFGFASGAQSWKPVLFPARQLLWQGRRTGDGFTVEEPTDAGSRFGSPPYALLGVRSCDLHAIGIHDRVLLGRAGVDAHYAAARQDVFVVAVACSDPSGTCFCVSMRTGPRPESGFDLCLTEISTAADGHRLVAEAGSDRGAEILAALPAEHAAAAVEADRAAAAQVTEVATGRMGRQLDTEGLRDVLYAGVESPRWDDVASRCLACTNCTLVCPTCFCTSVDDETDLTGDVASRRRSWDSCFTGDFSHLHGGSVRASVRSRYRQWATHKLASWYDQFGTSGCVGCGRCITWCPAAIDITEEAAAVRADPGPPSASAEGA